MEEVYFTFYKLHFPAIVLDSYLRCLKVFIIALILLFFLKHGIETLLQRYIGTLRISKRKC